MGFEPTNNGFANRRLSPLGYAAEMPVSILGLSTPSTPMSATIPVTAETFASAVSTRPDCPGRPEHSSEERRLYIISGRIARELYSLG